MFTIRDRYPFLRFVVEPTQPEGGKPDGEEIKTFTQEEVNSFLAKELGPLREQIKSLKPAADELAKIKESQQTELERLTSRAEAAEQRIAEYEAKEARAALLDAISAEKKLDAKAKGLLAKSGIADEAALREYAAELAEAITTAPRIPTPLYTPTAGGDTSNKEAAARAAATALLRQSRS